MKHLLHILLLFVWVQGAAFGQEPFDSVRREEINDSLGSVAIKPVKFPKRLLKQVINRLHKDLQETHQGRSYRVEGTFRRGSRSPYSASCTYNVKDDNGLEITGNSNDTSNIKAPKMEDFCYEGPYKLNSRDTLSLKDKLLSLLQYSPSHLSNAYFFGYYPPSPFVYYEETARWYDVAAYEYGYDSDKGVYRIILVKRKSRYQWRSGDRHHWFTDIRVIAYFDRRTLRIMKISCEQSGDKTNYMSVSNGTDFCIRFKADYDEENETPVLKQIRYINTNGFLSINGTVRRIDD